MVAASNVDQRPLDRGFDQWRRASLRYIVPIVLVIGLPGSLGLMGALLFGISWVLIDTRIGLMDRLGQTRVVLARYRPERPQ